MWQMNLRSPLPSLLRAYFLGPFLLSFEASSTDKERCAGRGVRFGEALRKACVL